MYTEGTATVDNSTFVGNTALALGGGIVNEAGFAVVKNTLFRDNAAEVGAGMSNSGGLTLQNATFSGNCVRQDGVLVNYGKATVQNATFSENVDATGNSGASVIWQVSAKPLHLKNVVVKRFVDGGFGGDNCSSFDLTGYVPLVSDGFNLSDDTSCAPFFTAAGDKNNTDPLLGPLADNGGADQCRPPSLERITAMKTWLPFGCTPAPFESAANTLINVLSGKTAAGQVYRRTAAGFSNVRKWTRPKVSPRMIVPSGARRQAAMAPSAVNWATD